nr:unnamed protein product [Digitaria exilis]
MAGSKNLRPATPTAFVHRQLPWAPAPNTPVHAVTASRGASAGPWKNPPPYGLVTAPASSVARLITTPSIPTSALGDTSGGACGPYAGWWNGHAHSPGHCSAAFPTHTYANLPRPRVPEAEEVAEAWRPQWERQKPSTMTSGAVTTTATDPRCGERRRAARAAREVSERRRPRESDGSSTWRPSRAVVAHHAATEGAADEEEDEGEEGAERERRKSATTARWAGVKRPYQRRLTE